MNAEILKKTFQKQDWQNGRLSGKFVPKLVVFSLNKTIKNLILGTHMFRFLLGFHSKPYAAHEITYESDIIFFTNQLYL